MRAFELKSSRVGLYATDLIETGLRDETVVRGLQVEDRDADFCEVGPCIAGEDSAETMDEYSRVYRGDCGTNSDEQFGWSIRAGHEGMDYEVG